MARSVNFTLVENWPANCFATESGMLENLNDIDERRIPSVKRASDSFEKIGIRSFPMESGTLGETRSSDKSGSIRGWLRDCRASKAAM